MTAAGPADPGADASTVATVDDLLARAHAMELEATERYEEFAAQLELHGNVDVAGLFRKLAGAERKHAEQIARDLESRGVAVGPATALAAPGAEGLETDLGDTLHYLMTPYHALQIAQQNELRALAFFTELAQRTASDDIRRLATEFAREEEVHVGLVRARLAREPEPGQDWAYDPDGPRMPD
jgi:rubrerythrin